MAAYASLLSLGHILDDLLQHPPRQMAVLDKAQIHSLIQNITFLQDFLEEFSLVRGDKIHGLEEKIARSAYAAEDIIEKRVVDQILEDSEAGSESGTLFRQNLQKVMIKIDSMKKDVMKIKETEGIQITEQPRKAAVEDIIGSRVVDQILPNSKAERRRRGIFSCLNFVNHFRKETEGIKIIQWPRKAATAGSSIRGASKLEEKIASSAYAAEDIIERHVVDQILEDSEAGSESSSTLFCQDLQKVIEEFDSMMKDVTKIKETEGIKIVQQPRKAATAGSSIGGASNSKNTMVGFDDDLIQIMEKLTGHQSNLRIVSIVGMGGIGKTTLARNVYHHPCIVQHFHVHAWVTISQQYSVREILLALLKDIIVLAEYRKEEERKEINQLADEELGEQLYKSLSGRKYLIVMDDVWSNECWDDIKRFFPGNNNGSRVMMTTRLTNVADDYCSCAPHQLHFLDKDQSWALFCDKVFGKESCPPELEVVGKTIVRNCGALPLAIVVIGGLLAKSRRTIKYWEHVANDTYAALNMGGDGLCLEILSLSYKHLPVHLKPCFLYMAIFPEDHKIKISRLVKLWVAEGILKPMDSKSLEEIAVDNLKDLIDRNLIMIHDYGSRNKIKTCTIHDLLRDLCLIEARKVKFLRVTMNHSLNNSSRIIHDERQFIIKRISHGEELKSTVAKLQHRLRKVLKMGYICSDEEIVRLVNSKYIDFSMFENLLNTLESLSLLWNLQTVTIDVGWRQKPALKLPGEIWEMPQLRHLKIKGGYFYLPDPPSANSKNGRGDIIVLKNLQTLYKIRNFRCTDEVLNRIPNLKKLGITYKLFSRGIGWDYHEVHNLTNLHNLESLFFESYENVPRNLCFPQSLKKLTLEKCEVCWEDLTVVGSLPHLEVLNLMEYSVKGREWSPVEGEFLELKSLRIDSTYLVEWIADSSHFPRLEKLELRSLIFLKEIPQGIGEIPTLGSISLEHCSDSANSSARKIQEEQQQNLGNYDLQLKIVEL